MALQSAHVLGVVGTEAAELALHVPALWVGLLLVIAASSAALALSPLPKPGHHKSTSSLTPDIPQRSCAGIKSIWTRSTLLCNACILQTYVHKHGSDLALMLASLRLLATTEAAHS